MFIRLSGPLLVVVGWRQDPIIAAELPAAAPEEEGILSSSDLTLQILPGQRQGDDQGGGGGDGNRWRRGREKSAGKNALTRPILPPKRLLLLPLCFPSLYKMTGTTMKTGKEEEEEEEDDDDDYTVLLRLLRTTEITRGGGEMELPEEEEKGETERVGETLTRSLVRLRLLGRVPEYCGDGDVGTGAAAADAAAAGAAGADKNPERERRSDAEMYVGPPTSLPPPKNCPIPHGREGEPPPPLFSARRVRRSSTGRSLIDLASRARRRRRRRSRRRRRR